MYVCLKVILSTEHNYFLTDDLMSQRGQMPICNPLYFICNAYKSRQGVALEVCVLHREGLVRL